MSESGEFCRHNPLKGAETSNTECKLIFRTCSFATPAFHYSTSYFVRSDHFENIHRSLGCLGVNGLLAFL
jgi:hypothetical protein